MRVSENRQPNLELHGWWARSGLSQGEVARRVRAAARAAGHPHVACDAASVGRWFAGQLPRPPVPEILADVFSAHFRTRVTVEDLGMAEASRQDRALVYNSSFPATVEAVTDLGRADVDRRGLLASATFAIAASIGPSRDWLVATLDQGVGSRRVGMADVGAVRNMFGVFQEMDVMQGGGSGRLALAAYMNEHVYPLLRGSQTASVWTALCQAAAEQTYLLGWMAYDNGEHGKAQRYLIQALRLAQESGDATLGAHVLAGMSDQATLLGHPGEGLRLAQAGRHGLPAGASPACLADLRALEARAAAALGDAPAATSAILASEQAIASVDVDSEPEWARFIDTAYLHGEYAHAFRDLGQPIPAAEHAHRSIDAARSQRRARRGAMSQAALAVTFLQSNDLEAAHAAGVRTIDLARKVRSSRCTDAVQDLRKRMVPYGRHPLVADFSERTRELVRAA